jgi:hypothetical protein
MCAEDGAGGYVITEQFVKDMLAEFKEQRLIHKRFAFQILLQVNYIKCKPVPAVCVGVGVSHMRAFAPNTPRLGGSVCLLVCLPACGAGPACRQGFRIPT